MALATEQNAVQNVPWWHLAACRGMDVNIFFPDGKRGKALLRAAEAAQAVCADCPVRTKCKDWSETARERYGVWGGVTANQRRARLKLPK